MNKMTTIVVLLFMSCSLFKTKSIAFIEGFYEVVNVKNSDESAIIGKIYDRQSMQPIPYVLIHIDDLKKGVVSDTFGNFVLPVPPGRYSVVINNAGNTKFVINNLNIEKNIVFEIAVYMGSSWQM
jgi:hypothetical protein